MSYLLNLSVNNGVWVTPHTLYVNDGGTWRQINTTYINDNGTWRKIYERYNGILDNVEYTGTTNFTSRDGAPAQGQGWFKYVPGSGWWTRAWVHQDSGGFTADSGWVNGNSYVNPNQAGSCMIIPNGSTVFSVPVLQNNGNHYSGQWYARWCHTPEVSSFNNAGSVPADWYGSSSYSCGL